MRVCIASIGIYHLALGENESIMPNIKSAVKRMRQNAKLRSHNRSQRSALRTAIKRLNSAIEGNNAEQARELLNPTLSIIGKSAQKGLIPRNKAARSASRRRPGCVTCSSARGAGSPSA